MSLNPGEKPNTTQPVATEGFFLFKILSRMLGVDAMNEFTVHRPKGLFDLSASLQNHVTTDTRLSSELLTADAVKTLSEH